MTAFPLRNVIVLSVAVLASLAAGCSIPHQPLQPLVKPVPSSFYYSLPNTGAPTELTTNWWETFDDPVLSHLVTCCLSSNYDLQLADARIKEARALTLQANTGRRPSVNGVAEYRRQHEPSLEKSGDPLLDRVFVAGVDASWELDFFGRIRNQLLAAQARAQAASDARSEVALTVAAEVARVYLELRGAQHSVATQQAAVKLRADQVTQAEKRMSLGVANTADIENAQENLADDRARLSELKGAIPKLIHRLGILTVTPIADLRQLVDGTHSLPAEPASPKAVSPTELLHRRPDIREAEQHLIASLALNSSARGALFPRISFDGQFSFYALGWGLGPRLSWDVFDRRRVKAHQAQAGARADAEFAQYQSAIINAVADVENAFVNLATARDRRDELRSKRDAAKALVERTRRRVALGISHGGEELDAEGVASNAAGELYSEEIAVREAWVAVFKALGGGWRATAS